MRIKILPLFLLSTFVPSLAFAAPRAGEERSRDERTDQRSDERAEGARGDRAERVRSEGTVAETRMRARQYKPRMIDEAKFDRELAVAPADPEAPTINVLRPRSGKGSILLERSEPQALGAPRLEYSAIRVEGRSFKFDAKVDLTKYDSILLKKVAGFDTPSFSLLVPKSGKGQVYIGKSGTQVSAPLVAKISL